MKYISMSFVLAVSLFASKAWAATVTWSNGYPKPGQAAGQIDVAGTFTPDTGWDIINCRAVLWKVGGGTVVDFTVNINTETGAWSATLDGLTSNQEYNIIIQCYQRRSGGTATKTIAADPGKSKAR